jgi:hypothetical protein
LLLNSGLLEYVRHVPSVACDGLVGHDEGVSYPLLDGFIHVGVEGSIEVLFSDLLVQ